MRIFVSWSGVHSKHIARELKVFLKRMFENENLDVFMSEEDIPSGRFWFEKIKEELNSSGCAIVCVTGDNTSAPWIYYEAGALAARRDVVSVIPFLFKTDLPAHTPLSPFHNVRYNDDDRQATEKTLRKMMGDIKQGAGFTNSTEKQMDMLFNEAYPDFVRGVKAVEDALNMQMEEGQIKIFPAGRDKLIRHSVFISAPMSGLSEEKYIELRENVQTIKEILLNHCGFEWLRYVGDGIAATADFDGAVKALRENLRDIKQCEAMVVLYPDNIKSSVLLEIGYAIALSKRIVLFTKSKEKLPFMLTQADVAIPTLKIFEYRQFSEIRRILSHNGKSLFVD